MMISFCSIGGIFVVFHAFTSMDDLAKQTQSGESFLRVVVRIYGPRMLLLFDWTGAMIALMAFLFTVGWLRRTGELTSTLAAGISHGRLLRPMIMASLAIVSIQLLSREFVLPRYRDSLSLNANQMAGSGEQSVKSRYDRINRALIDGSSLHVQGKHLSSPSFRLDGDYPGFGDLLLGKSARWVDTSSNLPSGYLIEDVQRPQKIDSLASFFSGDRPVLLTSHDQAWLKPGQAYFVTTVSIQLLQTNQASKRRGPVTEIAAQIRNPAVYSSMGMQVLLHERIVRAPLDFALILLVLPLVVNRKNRNLFMMIGATMMIILGFFALKMFAQMIGSSGYWVSPALAAWIPLMVIGPVAYVRYRDVQLI